MPIGARDILLIVRAKDEASRVLRGVGTAFNHVDSDARAAAARSIAAGSALVTIGAGMAGIGIAALNFFSGAKDAALEYNKQAALTQTQTIGTGIKLEELKDIGKRVASEIPAPFETLQDGLYDIFSSIDVNSKEAEKLLKQFAKDSVAGQVDVRTAVRANIEILNAYGLGAEDASHVSDIMFQMVAKGVGTYDEFTSAIGKSIPSARTAGAEIETVAGMMAFLTQQGLTTSMASTSVARAFDLISNSKVSGKLGEFGVAVFDANGNFRQMHDIVRDLDGKLKGLTAEEKVKKLGELFKGGGNSVQAQRFFKAALNNFDALDKAVGHMHNSAGVANEAYGIMFKDPAVQAELLSNRWKVLKSDVGDVLIPMFEKLVEVGNKVIGWFTSLDPEVKNIIIKGAVLAAIFMTVVGTVLMVVGAFLIIQGTMALLGITFGGIILTIGAVLLVLAALVLAGYLVYKNWDTIKKYGKIVWDAIREYVTVAWNKIKEIWPKIVAGAIEAWTKIKEIWEKIKEIAVAVAEVVKDVWDSTVAFFRDLWNQFGDEIIGIFKGIGEFFQQVWADIIDWWNNNDIAEKMREAFQKIADAFAMMVDRFKTLWDNILYPVMKVIFDVVKTIWLEGVWPAIRTAMEGILKVIGTVIDIISTLWKAWGDKILAIITITWNTIVGIITAVIEILVGIFSLFIDFFTGNWSKLWEDVKQIFKGIWDLIVTIFSGIVDTIVELAKGLIETIVHIPGKILDLVANIGVALLSTGRKLIGGLIDGVIEGAKGLWDWISNLDNTLLNFLVNAGKWLFDIGKAIIQGIIDGVIAMKDKLLGLLAGIGDAIKRTFKGILHIESPSRVFFSYGENIIRGLILGIQNEIPALDSIMTDVGKIINDLSPNSGGGVQGIPGPGDRGYVPPTGGRAPGPGRDFSVGNGSTIVTRPDIILNVNGPVSVEKWSPTALAEELAWQIRLVN